MLKIESYAVALRFTEKLLGGQSLNPELADMFISLVAKNGGTDIGTKGRRESVNETQEILASRVEATKEANNERLQELRRRTELSPAEESEMEALENGETTVDWPQGFARDVHGAYMPSITVKAGLKSALSRQNVFVEKRGAKTEQHVGFFIGPNRLRFYDQKLQPITTPDPYDTVVKPISITGPTGRRSAVVGFEAMPSGTILPLTINSIGMRKLTWDHIEQALLELQTDGLWASRSQGFGQFEIVVFDGPDYWEESVRGDDGDKKFADLFKAVIAPNILKAETKEPLGHIKVESL
jgi:hypothetical protein